MGQPGVGVPCEASSESWLRSEEDKALERRAGVQGLFLGVFSYFPW